MWDSLVALEIQNVRLSASLEEVACCFRIVFDFPDCRRHGECAGMPPSGGAPDLSDCCIDLGSWLGAVARVVAARHAYAREQGARCAARPDSRNIRASLSISVPLVSLVGRSDLRRFLGQDVGMPCGLGAEWHRQRVVRARLKRKAEEMEADQRSGRERMCVRVHALLPEPARLIGLWQAIVTHEQGKKHFFRMRSSALSPSSFEVAVE